MIKPCKKSLYDSPEIVKMEIAIERGFELSSTDSQLDDMFETEGSWD